jgi:cytochrome c
MAGLVLGLSVAAPAWSAGDVQRGAQAARQCMACHSFAPGRHMTGPSLAGLWGRHAGTAMGFARYSEAMQGAHLVWGPQTLDAWLREPQALIPGNTMLFRGMPDATMRADLLAFLQATSDGRIKVPDQASPDLKRAQASSTVRSIRYCGDAYRVATGDGSTRTWWEFNLRFKTDASANGPAAGKPVLVGNGMQGDRASVVFSRPEEISAFVRRQCP